MKDTTIAVDLAQGDSGTLMPRESREESISSLKLTTTRD